ncbi:MAG: class I SAM-dependent methyltransferase, partial [Syntrophobacteraceae bacterium]
LANYPKAKRDLQGRLEAKTEDVRAVARQFGKEFFDGGREYGYGGFSYNPRFWQPVIPAFEKHFGLTQYSTVLDVGCAKGFMLHDMAAMVPGISVRGIDVSEYAIANAIDDMAPFVQVANATKIPFPDNSFDVVISINTIHNLEQEECAQALKEIERVSCGKSFVTVDAYRTEEEKRRMYAWNLTAKTIMSIEEWICFFGEAGYTGDYFWFVP